MIFNIGMVASFSIKQANNSSQVVLDAMVDFFQQYGFGGGILASLFQQTSIFDSDSRLLSDALAQSNFCPGKFAALPAFP
jgi:hypothetical protein